MKLAFYSGGPISFCHHYDFDWIGMNARSILQGIPYNTLSLPIH